MRGGNNSERKAVRETSEERERFEAAIEAEKIRLRSCIEEGVRSQARLGEIHAEARALVARGTEALRTHASSQEAETLFAESEILLDPLRTRRGTVTYYLFDVATPYANLLLRDEKALTMLATVGVLYQKKTQRRELPYWHNLAQGYLELAKFSQGELEKKLQHLFAATESPITTLYALRPEDILYALIDEGFDSTLSPEKVTGLLDEHLPTWKNYPATHGNKEVYLNYNDPSVLGIIELNKLRAVIEQLRNPEFVSSIFYARDLDLQDSTSEHGGVIPRPEDGSRVEVYPGARTTSNHAYVTPVESVFRGLISPAEFHFHAIELETERRYQGPSAADNAFFTGGVVFSSIDHDTILVHFFSSRESSEPGTQQEVVCLGEIKRGRDS